MLVVGVVEVSRITKTSIGRSGEGDSDDDDDQKSDDEQTKSDNPMISDDEEETQEDEFVHTPKNYVPTDDETNDVDDDEYDCINKKMYSDVNVELKDKEIEGDQVKDDAQVIVIAANATQKTEVPLASSSILSSYATKFLNFDNIPSADTKIISMMDIKAQ
nr:hypothetical protein [Tanacetum cinerariifolium]